MGEKAVFFLRNVANSRSRPIAGSKSINGGYFDLFSSSAICFNLIRNNNRIWPFSAIVRDAHVRWACRCIIQDAVFSIPP